MPAQDPASKAAVASATAFLSAVRADLAEACRPLDGAARPAVSVVIPCYRQAEYLRFAVGSVVLQTFRDWEIVIVDDGSPDDTAAVAADVVASLPGRRIRLLRQANGGLAAARNAGVRASRGRYVLPLDSDDGLDAEYLARTVPVLERDAGVAIVGTDAFYFGVKQERVRNDATATAQRLARGNQLNYCSLYRREVFDAVGGYAAMPVMGYEDWNFWISAAELGFRGAHVHEPLFLYRTKPESMITGAERHDALLRAWIVTKHPGLYPPEERERAEAVTAAPFDRLRASGQ